MKPSLWCFSWFLASFLVPHCLQLCQARGESLPLICQSWMPTEPTQTAKGFSGELSCCPRPGSPLFCPSSLHPLESPPGMDKPLWGERPSRSCLVHESLYAPHTPRLFLLCLWGLVILQGLYFDLSPQVLPLTLVVFQLLSVHWLFPTPSVPFLWNYLSGYLVECPVGFQIPQVTNVTLFSQTVFIRLYFQSS